MELIKTEELRPYIAVPVQVGVQDASGERAPLVSRVIQKAAICPDGTHIRLYFDRRFFLAVPRKSCVTKNEQEWMAFDQETELSYIVRKEEA
ncbi:hypothetical protein RRU94_00120 [Domibacillus sp. DTU_2020_1001157_1_SI_ALB_TIR_016]|uniref:hypothetical protein n=1 Tax=Domibacillus sp. DTU_2020_1001157_1_SI_ALB_TIR_016 TaxID=3077789 RepID=UPI0028EBFD1B|nr:hypothetical protein [Domibacillus sp. DTU_2020_1001157_1_SI_ALB_TIR_016]WNS78417.1 hypothetical protein RRU94_00120 [Domibacillus sp. DTU_2020_1001157_1_SI_ALB_TIR_016]